MPGLIWNMMMSKSGGWFFVVASEAITVGDKTITLPGIGAYLARATREKDLAAVGWVVLTMTVVIILYDQLMFRPLVAWAEAAGEASGRNRGSYPAHDRASGLVCASFSQPTQLGVVSSNRWRPRRIGRRGRASAP